MGRKAEFLEAEEESVGVEEGMQFQEEGDLGQWKSRGNGLQAPEEQPRDLG